LKLKGIDRSLGIKPQRTQSAVRSSGNTKDIKAELIDWRKEKEEKDLKIR